MCGDCPSIELNKADFVSALGSFATTASQRLNPSKIINKNEMYVGQSWT